MIQLMASDLELSSFSNIFYLQLPSTMLFTQNTILYIWHPLVSCRCWKVGNLL